MVLFLLNMKIITDCLNAYFQLPQNILQILQNPLIFIEKMHQFSAKYNFTQNRNFKNPNLQKKSSAFEVNALHFYLQTDHCFYIYQKHEKVLKITTFRLLCLLFNQYINRALVNITIRSDLLVRPRITSKSTAIDPVIVSGHHFECLTCHFRFWLSHGLKS